MHQDKSPNSVLPTVPNAQLSYRVSSDDKMQCDKINADQTNKIEVISDAIISRRQPLKARSQLRTMFLRPKTQTNTGSPKPLFEGHGVASSG